MPDFEEDARRSQGRTRHDDAVSDTQVGGYRNTDDGAAHPLLGNEDGPYQNALGRATTTPFATDPGVPAVETGKGQRLLVDEFGRLITLDATVAPDVTTQTLVPVVATPVEAVIGVEGAGLLYEATAADLRAAPATPLYLLVFDQLAQPVLNDHPILSFAISNFSDIDYTTEAGPMPFVNGLWIAISSTPVAYTAISSALFTLVLRTGV